MVDVEQFNLTPQIDEPTCTFKIVHLNNRSDTYHLTRQVLLDATLTQSTYCFFYHILAMDMDDFNKMYGSFACLIARSEIEADIYLNVDPEALNYIIKYVQTNKINGAQIYSHNWKIIDEMIDLATMFGMPNLVSMLRNLHPSEENITQTIQILKDVGENILTMYKENIDSDYKIEIYLNRFYKFLEENRESIIDVFIKKNMYTMDPFTNKFLMLLCEVLITPALCKYIKYYRGKEKNHFGNKQSDSSNIAEEIKNHFENKQCNPRDIVEEIKDKFKTTMGDQTNKIFDFNLEATKFDKDSINDIINKIMEKIQKN